MTPQSTVAAGEEVDSARLLVSRFPNLDALRTIALVMVLLFHQGLLPFGWAGVQIFFVLSGYLITRLLVRDRGQPVGTFFLGFYARRSLRIFPLYFLVVALLWLLVARGLDMGGVRAGLPYAATYTYNFFHASNAFQHSKLLSHFLVLVCRGAILLGVAAAHLSVPAAAPTRRAGGGRLARAVATSCWLLVPDASRRTA